ncbi:M13 family metallopeptidase [Methanoculleus sp. UBA291]|jgi:putative endopeptidase|uniref:M13 family metallopeptidase n=2 Tax=Methanoculleus TaxID=45989 RepID=UPI00316AEAE3
MKRISLTLLLIACLVCVGCSASAGTVVPDTGLQTSESGFIFNESVRPGDDFYAYVNDAWIAEHPIPADKQYYATLTGLQDRVNNDLHSLLLNASTAPTQGADRNTTLLGQFYRSGMDNETIDGEGLSGLSDLLTTIDSIDSRADLTDATIVLLEQGFGPVYSYWAEVNPENSSEMVPGLYQGGLGLPDRDYYLRNDTESTDLQDAYRDHIARVLVLAGEPADQAAADAETVYTMEKTLATTHLSAEENRDPGLTTNLYTLAELEDRYPAIGWETLSTTPGSGPVGRVHLYQPGYVEGLNTLLETAPLEDWKVYLRYRLIDGASPYLSSSFEEERFDFYSRALYGVPEMKPRWQRVVDTESISLGDLVGRAYVAEYVDPRTREMVLEMFFSIRETLDERIANLTWMGNFTKTAAHEKLAAMGEKIAYPDRWTDYSGLTLSDSYVENVRAAQAHSFIHGPNGLERIGGPVDRSLWSITPQTVNAFYDPTRNEMVFPAGVLQPPIFDPDADPALNYAALGWMIGHEMTHGFDDEGRQYDKDGNLKDWWTKEDAENFNNRTAMLVAEYNRFEALPGLYVNGNLTLGENIADFGGLTLAYHAWKKAENRSDVVDTAADRRFFFGAATLWRVNDREDSLRNLVLTDPHSPENFRVNGVLFNIPEFYEAFPEIRPDDALYREVEERPVIW